VRGSNIKIIDEAASLKFAGSIQSRPQAMMKLDRQHQSFLLEALEGLDAEHLSHVNGQLISHLEDTCNYLVKWGNREALCIAGLYHATYSTDGYSQQLIDINQRDRIIHLIGADAENIVYYYAACDRDYFYSKIGRSKDFSYHNRFTDEKSCLELQLFCDLLELTLANEIEIVSNNRSFKEQHRAWYIDLFNRFEPYVSRQAFQCYQNVFSF
jgi:hypothetical protein